MNKLIVLAMTILTTTSAFACTCQGPEFDQRDKIITIENFLESKLSVENKDIIFIQTKSTEAFLTPVQKLTMKVFKKIESKSDYECIESCQYYANEISTHEVIFKRNERECLVKLTTKMYSNLFNMGFKSKVIQKFRPICN